MHVTVTRSGLLVNGTFFAEAPVLSDLMRAFGNPKFREKVIYDNEAPWRKFLIMDDIGICFLFDFEINRVIDINFYFSHVQSENCPSKVFPGLLFLNGKRLVAGLGKSSLPLRGEFKFLQTGGWEAQSDFLFVNIRIQRRSKELEALAVAFLERPPFHSEAGK